MIDWIDFIENKSTEILCFLEDKSPVEIVSDPLLKSKLVKIMFEMVKAGRYQGIEFPNNFINHNIVKASMSTKKDNIKINQYFDEITYIIDKAQENRVNVSTLKDLFESLKIKDKV